MRTIVVLAGLATVLIASGPASAADRGTLTVRPSEYGRVLFDGKGFALYAFTHDLKGKSRCSGACAVAWPPYTVKTRAKAGTGVSASLLGTTRRADGSLQVTYAGRPLYYYVGEKQPGLILCQGVDEFGGLWLVQRASGKLVR